MGFGNFYGDFWNVEIVEQWIDCFVDMGICILQFLDIIGVVSLESISYLFSNIMFYYLDIEFGVYFYIIFMAWKEKVVMAYEYGCWCFDGVICGYGGCFMAKDDLMGNMFIENMVYYFCDIGVDIGVVIDYFGKLVEMVGEVFLFQKINRCKLNLKFGRIGEVFIV